MSTVWEILAPITIRAPRKTRVYRASGTHLKLSLWVQMRTWPFPPFFSWPHFLWYPFAQSRRLRNLVCSISRSLYYFEGKVFGTWKNAFKWSWYCTSLPRKWAYILPGRAEGRPVSGKQSAILSGFVNKFTLTHTPFWASWVLRPSRRTSPEQGVAFKAFPKHLPIFKKNTDEADLESILCRIQMHSISTVSKGLVVVKNWCKIYVR